jgi:hypothetical protein
MEHGKIPYQLSQVSTGLHTSFPLSKAHPPTNQAKFTPRSLTLKKSSQGFVQNFTINALEFFHSCLPPDTISYYNGLVAY